MRSFENYINPITTGFTCFYSAGGSCDNANMSSDLYTPANREDVLELFDYKDDTERANLNEIMTRMYVCLSIINSDKFIDVDKFENYCKRTMIRLKEIFPWMDISTTIHMFLAHGPQFIRANENRGLLQYSESPLEVVN